MEEQNQHERHDFTKKGIIEFLRPKLGWDCVGVSQLSEGLGTISPRMVRLHASSGKLKSISPESSYYLFNIDDIAEWLLRYPKYIFKKKVDNSDMTVERVTQLSEYTRNYVRKKFPGILKYMDIEDVVMEVLAIICKKDHKNATDATLVFRAICTLYRKAVKKVEATSVDPNKLEEVVEGDVND